MNKLSDYIRVFKFDLLRQESEIKQLNGWSKHQWYKPSTGEYHSEQTKELDVMRIDGTSSLFDSLMGVLVSAAAQYFQAIGLEPSINHLSPVRLNRYPTGSLMRPHVDHIHSLFEGEARGIPVLSLVGLLNDDYSGGDLILCGERQALRAGDVIVFPSCFLYPHEVTEVTDGARYSFVSWGW